MPKPKKPGREAAKPRVNPAARAWTPTQKILIEKLSGYLMSGTLGALGLSPRVRLKILADCAERIKSGGVPPLRRAPDVSK